MDWSFEFCRSQDKVFDGSPSLKQAGAKQGFVEREMGLLWFTLFFLLPPRAPLVLMPVPRPRLRHCVGFAASALFAAPANPESRWYCEVASRRDDAASDSWRGGRGHGELLPRLPVPCSPSRRSDQHVLARQREERGRGGQGAVGIHPRVPSPGERAFRVRERAHCAPWLPAANRGGEPEVDTALMVKVCPET